MSGVMTTKKLNEAVRHGFGQGRGESYQSWIRVRRKLSSKVSKLQSMATPLYAHRVHLLSGLEKQAANVGLWLGAKELREQRPAWPDEHEHPGSGMHPDLDKLLPRVRGLLDVAKELGVAHGVYVGTKIPFVATFDFTWAIGPWERQQLINWGCKPRELLETAKNRTRMKERIAMEEVNSADSAALHRTIDGTQWTQQLANNLDAWKPLRSHLGSFLHTNAVEDFAWHFMSVADEASVLQAMNHAAQVSCIPNNLKNCYFGAAAWNGLIDIDFRQTVEMHQRLKRDVRNFKAELRRALFGV